MVSEHAVKVRANPFESQTALFFMKLLFKYTINITLFGYGLKGYRNKQ